MKKKILFLAFFLLFLSVSQVNAALSVVPTVTEVTLDGGESSEGVFHVQNSDTFPLRVKIIPEDWLVRRGKEGDVLAAKDWFSVTSEPMELAPGEIKQIPFKIQAPSDFYDEKVAQVFFEFSSDYSPSFMKTRVGVIVYMSSKRGKVQGELGEFAATYSPARKAEDGSIQKPNFRVSFQVKNTGDLHIRPFGKVLIKNSHTGEIVSNVLFESGKGVFSNSEDSFDKIMETTEQQPGSYFAEATIDIGQLHGKDLILTKNQAFKIE